MHDRNLRFVRICDPGNSVEDGLAQLDNLVKGQFKFVVRAEKQVLMEVDRVHVSILDI